VAEISVERLRRTRTARDVPSPTGIAFSDARFAYVTGYTGTMGVFDMKSFSISSTSGAGSDPLGFVLTRSGLEAFVADAGTGSVAELDLTAHKIDMSVSAGAGTEAVALTAAGPV
jgi:DNA-binding beta-propeller fold protein YncE